LLLAGANFPQDRLTTQVAALQRIIDDSQRMVFFGGAGVSTESGLPDFRGSDGLYRQKFRFPPEIMLSHSFFISHPDEFYEFHKSRMIRLDIRPNPTHVQLAALEAAGRLKAVITQNIDGLHQMAGSRKVLELHGSVHRNYCLSCGKIFDAAFIVSCAGVPRCSCGGLVRPDVVLYEESLDPALLREAARLIGQADTLIVGGTSLVVYPAAGLVDYFSGSHLVLINKDVTPLDSQAELALHGPIGEIMGRIIVPMARG
jgi:NAD-dependent deacetylase